MNYLSLDYGIQKTGVAIATSPISEPLTTIKTKELFIKLPEILTKYQIDHIIIGNCPDEFVAKLQIFKLPVIQVDETLTTVDATKLLLHTTQSRRKSKIHEVSAALILQNHLDTNIFPSL